MALTKCKECGHDVSENALYCPNCGYAFEKTKFCKFCGKKIPKDVIICTICGRQVEYLQENSQTNIYYEYPDMEDSDKNCKNKYVSLLLCIFLGAIGAHKFYEGKILLGIIYLLTGGLLGVGWVVDIFIILFKPNPYYV